MAKQLRASLYFSRRKDKDIIKALGFEEIEQGDINWKIKELMRDGIKYRNNISSPVDNNREEGSMQPSKIHKFNIAENTDSIDDEFEDIELDIKELDEREIRKKLDNF